MFARNPNPVAPKATPIAAAMAIAALAACVDEPMSPTFDDTSRDAPPNPSRAPHRIDRVDLDRLEREAELGHPSSAGGQAPGTGPWHRDDEADWITTAHGRADSVVPAKVVPARPEPAEAHNASSGIARRLDLDIPEVCHRDSPALPSPSSEAWPILVLAWQ